MTKDEGVDRSGPEVLTSHPSDPRQREKLVKPKNEMRSPYPAFHEGLQSMLLGCSVGVTAPKRRVCSRRGEPFVSVKVITLNQGV